MDYIKESKEKQIIAKLLSKHDDNFVCDNASETMFGIYPDVMTEIIDYIKVLHDMLDDAYNLVGHPATNVSSSTDIACDQWREKYKKMKDEEN